MALKQINYGDIRHLLESEGFERSVVPKSHVVYDHKASGANLLLPIERATTKAQPAHVAMVRLMLVDFGIMKSEEVENWIANPKRFQAA